ncbi:hypothetical protein B0H17DRAFT_430954 [Mycena rosella]|uniref:Uncharacterized protein n=1 Tax=Mycena rosella TaxID=1033263 RepID=A0AAD7DQM4_MYCRO|nr:hypothetical protein B0H17DRAFT_430954 [Mycena rosella]
MKKIMRSPKREPTRARMNAPMSPTTLLFPEANRSNLNGSGSVSCLKYRDLTCRHESTTGGFIKFALTEGHPANVNNSFLLANENIINGQCYTGGCDKDGFDPGDTHVCVGKNVTIPNWVADGDYVFSFSSIGGFDSDAIPTKQLPLYHNCANIKIQGGVALEDRPADWIAPFIGGSKDNVNGPIPPDQCAFKNFRAEPEDPSVVNVNDVANNMQFGLPDGWAVPGGSPSVAKRLNDLILRRLGHVARAVGLSEDD